MHLQSLEIFASTSYESGNRRDDAMLTRIAEVFFANWWYWGIRSVFLSDAYTAIYLAVAVGGQAKTLKENGQYCEILICMIPVRTISPAAPISQFFLVDLHKDDDRSFSVCFAILTGVGEHRQFESC